LKTPSDARARKYKVWGESHARVFSGSAIEPYIIAAIVGSRVATWLRASGYATSKDEVERLVATRGAFHVARIAAFMSHGSDSWAGKRDVAAAEIKELEADPAKLDGIIAKAFELLVSVIRAVPSHAADVDKALKSAQLDRDIDQWLHTKVK
jgi:hypothetical protein